MIKKATFKLTALWIITLFIVSVPFFAQEMKVKDSRFTIGDVITLESKLLKETRTFYVSCPPGYESGSGEFPVLYVLDGDGRFPYAASVTQFLSNAGRIPEFIVVALSNGPRRSTRDRDMTPAKIPGESSGIEHFQQFMEKELFPFIEGKYRTQPYRILFGHSLAGLYTFYTLFTQPHLFNAYIASSPSIMYREASTLEVVKKRLAQGFESKRMLYFTVGDEPRYVPAIEKADALLKEKPVPNLQWNYVRVTGEHHRSMPLKALYNSLEKIFSGYDMPSPYEIGALEVPDLKQRFADYSKKYGFQIRIPEIIINYMGYMAMQKKNMKKAKEAFKYNVYLYPKSPNALDSLGEFLEKTGAIEKARKCFEKAVAMATKTNHSMLKDFKKSLERINNKKTK
jgi:predicted alpha/beta superfamily hydrolase